MESSIFVSAPFKGVFWHFKVDRRILLTLTVLFILTGQRPFLPNMSPGQWIDYVECKKYEDISVMQDIDGEVKYLTQLCPETQVCPPLSRMIELWLRSLLDWSPATRCVHEISIY